MTSRRLSDSDKKKILELYRQPGETTSTLASRYGVSNSTVSRILKSGLSEEDYEALIQQKRGARSASSNGIAADSAAEAADEAGSEEIVEPTTGQLEIDLVPEPPRPTGRRSRRRSTAPESVAPESELDSQSETSETEAAQDRQQELQPQRVVEPIKLRKPAATPIAEPAAPSPNGSYSPEADVLEEILGEDLLDHEDLTGLDEDEDDLEDDEDLEDDDLEEGDLEEGSLLVGSRLEGKTVVQVLPLDEAPIPKTCYLVVDRSAELIARPLKEFGDLGQIPTEEIQEKTLPIFDNHRVAKRFSNPRTQRVIKLPDGKVLQKTSSHLQAKGITRLLIDGQVYSLN